MTHSIEIRHLHKEFQRGKKEEPLVAVNQLSLDVPTGKIFGFLGSNGAGKSTTIKMVCGLIQPTSGHVLVNGRDIARNRGQAMREIGVVLEGTRNIYWRLSAWDNLMYFGRLKGIRQRHLKEYAQQMLIELDLWERRKEPTGNFSRGMQQKVAVACALITNPAIVLLDEPTLGLDVQSARTLETWIRKLVTEQGKTIVLTTHQLHMAQKLCDHVAIMHRGKLVANESKTSLMQRTQGADYYEIKVGGHFEKRPSSWPPQIKVQVENGHTLINSTIASQTRLHQLIDDIKHTQMPLISINRIEPTLEEIFIESTRGG